MRTYYSFSFSIFFHVLVFLLIIYITKAKNTYINTSSNIINISSVVSVEAIGLPNILKKDLAEIDSLNQKTIEVSKDDMVLKQDNTDAVLKIKAISSLKEKIKQDSYLSKIKQIKGMGKVFTDGTPISLSGSSTTGDSDVYILKIQKLVSMNWEMPTWADLKNKKVLINCIINSDGTINKITLIESSGIKEIDDSAIGAIKKADPFPEPPYKFKDIFNSEGINFSFP